MNEYFKKMLRIEKLIHIPGALGDSEPSEDLRDFFDQSNDEIENVLGPFESDFKEELEEDEPLDEEAIWALCEGKTGFLGQFATPIMEHYEGGAMDGSWSCYTSTWLYAETFPELEKAGLEWVKQLRTSGRQAEREESYGAQNI